MLTGRITADNWLTINDDSVGIYHEMYIISKEQYEPFYINMPQYGLGKAMEYMTIYT